MNKDHEQDNRQEPWEKDTRTATINARIKNESNFPNLKEISIKDMRDEIYDLLVDDEEPISAYRTIRDQIVFTTKRLIVISIQGITGVRRAYFSYPYTRVQYFGVETTGVLDIDSELFLMFDNGLRLSFDFAARVNIKQISASIAKYIL